MKEELDRKYKVINMMITMHSVMHHRYKMKSLIGNIFFLITAIILNVFTFFDFHYLSFLNIDTLIVTKFDETKAFGTIFSLVYETDKPLSYFSIGQEVPDDLIPASSEFLVECMLEGFKKKRGEDGNTGK